VASARRREPLVYITKLTRVEGVYVIKTSEDLYQVLFEDATTVLMTRDGHSYVERERVVPD
jgi:hypothetical protein